jgi:hypothetical protein
VVDRRRQFNIKPDIALFCPIHVVPLLDRVVLIVMCLLGIVRALSWASLALRSYNCYNGAII